MRMKIGELYQWTPLRKVECHYIWIDPRDNGHIVDPARYFMLKPDGLVMILTAVSSAAHIDETLYKVLTLNGEVGWVCISAQYEENWHPATV